MTSNANWNYLKGMIHKKKIHTAATAEAAAAGCRKRSNSLQRRSSGRKNSGSVIYSTEVRPVLRNPLRELTPGERQLIKATQDGDIETVRALIASGVDVNAPNDDKEDFLGQTALHKAIKFGQHACAKVLLDNGADTRWMDQGYR